MAREIERKFLLKDSAWEALATRREIMRQGYLAEDSRCSVRIRIAAEAAYLNIKSATLGVSRHEFEYAVPVADAEEMLGLFCAGRCVEKVRHYVPYGAHLWEIDVFEGRNSGLVVAEIELQSADERFAVPDWLGAEVSADPRYYNSCLIDLPYADWPEASQR